MGWLTQTSWDIRTITIMHRLRLVIVAHPFQLTTLRVSFSWNGHSLCNSGDDVFVLLYHGNSKTHDPRHDKTNKVSVRPAKIQISLGIRQDWSESSQCAHWVAKDPRILQADSEDSYQTRRMPRLIWVVFAGRTLILSALSCRGSPDDSDSDQVFNLYAFTLSEACLYSQLP